MTLNDNIKRDFRIAAPIIAVLIALAVFSAVVTTPQSEAGAKPEHQTPAWQDPSLAGLSVAEDAERDAVQTYY